MLIAELDTPALLIDLDRLDHNITRVARYARERKFRLRPHTKTHKTPEIARMQLRAGAAGLTVAKPTEAEAMIEAEPPELLVAYPVIGGAKLERLVCVARKTHLSVALDSHEAARGLSEAAAGKVEIGVLVEANVGLNRSGVDPGPALIALAEEVDRLPGLRLEGFNFYAGHLWPPDPDFDEKLSRVSAIVVEIRDAFDRSGLPRPIISGGTTPTLFHSHRIAAMNEIRPGTSVFFDRMQALAGVCTLDDCAATIVATVVSAQSPERVIIDGGSKTFTSDPLRHGESDSWGHVIGAPNARFYKMNEEHGIIDATAADREFRVGDRVRIIPNHVCVAVNMHERMHAVRGDEVEAVWEVKGRGKLQ